ncbi:MAG: YggS family pyridoxal phosphate-dependent enzyme [Thermodesulfobacteriaceae bacterium]|nr:YggS family pyridoxal phosphate-dependent enzyme [Thermodesulfobacteriaceae bacterium]MCX8041891.1 YggS family pyridoxal phosphate-dependent enzyme [Thermodesulfobacteriaceae bacterium]MDW8135373.1 YggS family pyridoxal phosphate-dependent enzyme [Thermodesulfobacterium sp.]
MVKENYLKIKEKIEKVCLKIGRNPEEIKILGASKAQPVEKIKEAFEAGIKLFGENYVQEAEKKIKELQTYPIEWHFIGRLQTNKVKKALNLFSVIESLDRLELAYEIQKQAEKLKKEVLVFIEINVGKEESKAGVFPEDLEKFIEEVLKLEKIKIKGFMSLPPYKREVEEVRPYFKKVKELFERFKPFLGEDFRELSMGTSLDYSVAIEEGATLIRIGEALFGKRSYL